jgi:outer membrane lipoprotein-sorting protein
VIAVVAIPWFNAPSEAAVFNRMVDAVVSARSAKFQAEVKVEGQADQTFQALFLAPAKYRMDMGTAVNISDFAAGKMLTLIPAQKQAVIFQLNNAPKDHVHDNHFEQLRRMLDNQRAKLPAYERLGEKTIDGRKAMGFRIDSGIGTTTLWGDPKTGDPILIENIYTGIPRTEVVMSKFEMNVELAPEQFAQDIPKGYKVQTLDIDASKPGEEALLESLRIFAELSGGDFPDALDTASVTKAMIGAMLKGKLQAKQGEQEGQKMMNDAIKIGRGFQFALSLPPTANAHYAGKRVKKDTKDRPIFWYRPESSERYRVIDATLQVHDADEAPRVEGAVPLVKKAGGT